MLDYAGYAKSTLLLKRQDSFDHLDLELAEWTIRAAYEQVYRAVAFDIDGTLTTRDTIEIDRNMAVVIGHLLRRGIYVLLITGRGRPSTRAAAKRIVEYARISDFYARRLHCITHNGICWLRTPPQNPRAFLVAEEIIAERWVGIAAVKDLLLDDDTIRRAVGEGAIGISEEPTDLTYSLRVLIRDETTIELSSLRHKLGHIVSSVCTEISQVHIAQGCYGTMNLLDISTTNKTKALSYYAERLGIVLDQVLRIGDQGAENGNDYELLSSAHGFSVGSLSRAPDKCLPVLADDCQTQLTGVSATRLLLRRLIILSPLTLIPDREHRNLDALRTFQEHATLRAKVEFSLLFQRLKLRLHRLLHFGRDQPDLSYIGYEDVFDVLSRDFARMQNFTNLEFQPPPPCGAGDH